MSDAGPETTIVVSPVAGPARRIRVVRSDVPGVPFTLQEFEWGRCHWRPVGREPLEWVEVDGVRYDAGDGIGGAHLGP